MSEKRYRLPNGTAAPSDGLPLPVDDPVSNLHPTAQLIIATAQEIIAEEGLHRLTVRRIVERSGVNVSAIKYHFGGKAGLLAVLLDAASHDFALTTAAATRGSSGDERLQAFVDGALPMVTDRRAYRTFFELVPAALRSPALRSTASDLNAWFADWVIECLDLDSAGLAPETANALARLIGAVYDGLALQVQLDEERFPAEAPLALFEAILRAVLRGDIPDLSP